IFQKTFNRTFLRFSPVFRAFTMAVFPSFDAEKSGFSAFLDRSIGIVIMDALMIFSLDLIPGHVRMGVEFQGHVSYQIFHKYRVVIGSFGDVFLILALEQGIKLGAG